MNGMTGTELARVILPDIQHIIDEFFTKDGKLLTKAGRKFCMTHLEKIKKICEELAATQETANLASIRSGSS